MKKFHLLRQAYLTLKYIIKHTKYGPLCVDSDNKNKSSIHMIRIILPCN